jgi:DNA modification methylase
MSKATIYVGDVLTRLAEIPDGSVRTCVTSPPYWGLRDYGEADQLGLEPTPEAYVENMVKVFREVWRTLADDGTLWLNLGDSYFAKPKSNYDGKAQGLQSKNYGTGETTLGYRQQADKFKALIAGGYKNKDLVGIPWRVAFALQADGWYLRQDIIWAKPNPMPESVTDRCTKSHEYVFLLSKKSKYYYDNEAVKEDSVIGKWSAMPPIGGVKQTEGNDNNTYSGNTPPSDGKRNKRDVWTIATKPFKGAHFAVMPEALVEPCVLAGSANGDTVLDPFTGSGTVAVVALRHGRNFVGTELNSDYAEIARERITGASPMFNEVEVKL